MLKIGITGGIGSGKTTVCKVFETLGIPVFYADAAAKEVMVKDAVLMEGLRREFGEESYSNGDVLNRRHIANIVFNDDRALAKLNALVHPAVFRAFESWVANLSTAAPYVMKEAALLFESGSYQLCDHNVLVTAPVEIRLQRAMARDGSSQEEVKARMDKQFSDEQKAALADYMILNDETRSLVLQILDLHHQFLKMSGK